MSYGRRLPIGSAARENDDRRRADLRQRIKNRRLCRCGSGSFEDAISGKCLSCDPLTRDVYAKWLHKGSVQ